jgi:hypothetical protein
MHALDLYQSSEYSKNTLKEQRREGYRSYVFLTRFDNMTFYLYQNLPI